MADGQSFDSGVELDVTVSSSSLRSARKTIEDGLGDVEATVSPNGPAYSGGGSGGSEVASREAAMSRQLLSSQNNKLDSVTDSWGENLELNERRNFLLEELLEATGSGEGGGLDGPTPRGNGGLLGGLAGGAALLGLGALTIGGLGLGKLSDIEVPDIPPLEVPDIPPLKVPDVPQLGVPDIPDLGVPDIPKLGVPDVPPLGVPDIPQLGVPNIPDLGVPEIPDLGVPDIPQLGVPDIPDLGVPDLPKLEVPDIPPVPVAKPDWVPLPIQNPSGSGDSSPSLADRVATGVTSNAAMTWNLLEEGGQGALNLAGDGVNYAKENPGKTAVGLGALGLAAADGPLPFGDAAAMAMLPMVGMGSQGSRWRGDGNSSQTTFSQPPTPQQSTVTPPGMRGPSPSELTGNRARDRRQQGSGNVTVRQNVTVQGTTSRELDRKLESKKREILNIVRREFGG